MLVSRLDKDGDWTFGKSLANYARRDEAIIQNVVTRIKSFQNNWFLNLESGIDWITILQVKNNQDIIKSEIQRVTAATFGVLRVISIDVDLDRKLRSAKVNILFDTIYSRGILREIGVDEARII